MSDKAAPAKVIDAGPVPCASVQITTSRWSASVTLRDAEGNEIGRAIMSADGWYTEGSGLWVGTPEEYEEQAP